MNKLETKIYSIVKNHPFIKKIIKNLYQGIFDFFPRQKESLPKCIDFKEGYFFGFHDTSSLSMDDSKCLANKIPFDGRMPKKGEPMTIGYFDVKDGKFGDFHEIAKSYAWNYHKGCRLQWVNNNTVIYNTAEGRHLKSILKNLETGKNYECPYPIDAVFNNGSVLYATNFNYERLNRCMPGYGYPINDGDGDPLESAPSNSGLFIVDLKNNCKRSLLVSLKDLASIIGKEYSTSDYTHFVTHTEFSHDGKYIAFLYRVVLKGQEGKDMHKTWILVYSLYTKELTILPTQNSGSHYVWNDKNQIIASCVIDGKNCHVLYDLTNLQNFKIIDGKVLNSDGHQTFISDIKFITDTYPDRRRMARLYIANIDENNSTLIASIYSPKQFQTKNVNCHIACDLHPRTSFSRKYLTFDSPRTGKRSIYIMSLDKLNIP